MQGEVEACSRRDKSIRHSRCSSAAADRGLIIGSFGQETHQGIPEACGRYKGTFEFRCSLEPKSSRVEDGAGEQHRHAAKPIPYVVVRGAVDDCTLIEVLSRDRRSALDVVMRQGSHRAEAGIGCDPR